METLRELQDRWYGHGVSVNNWYKKIINDSSIINKDCVEDWFNDVYVPIEGIENYQINHDIGKPYCVEYDSEGKAHYPNHSLVSCGKYIERFGEDGFHELVKNDMIFHSGSMDEIKKYCEENHELAIHSYATAWAEIFSNSELFGGIDSTSFKIKRKKLIRAFKYVNKAHPP